MIEPIHNFVKSFGASIRLDENLTVEKRNRYFLLNKKLMKFISKDFFYAGIYLGKMKNGKFFPGFELLRMIGETNANKVVVDKKTEWLFICGRDAFRQGITKVMGASKKGDCVLVVNDFGECLGFGRIVCDLHKKNAQVAVNNISDIGDFLRRERQEP